MGKRDLLFAGLDPRRRRGARGEPRPASARPTGRRRKPAPRRPDVAAEVDRAFRRRWAEQGLDAGPEAPELAVMRRLSLALTGTIPSLEEIRRFEARPPRARLARWLDDLLLDRRSADYLAERLARAFVGTEGGPFLVYRRRRFVSWLSDELIRNRPYDELVRDLIAGKGVWTDHPFDQLHLRHLRPRQEGVRPRTAGRPGRPGVPRRPDRLRPVPRPPLPALEAGRFPGARRLLRPGRARLDRHRRQGAASSGSTTRRTASRPRSSPGSRSWPTSTPRTGPVASGWPGG